MTSRQVKALKDNPRLQVYANPKTFMTCNLDPLKALCDADLASGGKPRLRTPSFSRCDSRCPNLSRSDTDIDAARAEADVLGQEIASGLNPFPIEQRLRQRQTTLIDIIDKHQTTSIRPLTPTTDAI
jgi:hypothetical protein